MDVRWRVVIGRVTVPPPLNGSSKQSTVQVQVSVLAIAFMLFVVPKHLGSQLN